MAVLRGAGVFETRSVTIMRHRFQDAWRAEGVLEELKRKCRREAERKFGRNLGYESCPEECQRKGEKLDRLATIEHERAASPQPNEPPSYATFARPLRGPLDHKE
jgi:hypothetical protein